MSFKIVVSDPKTKKTYQKEVGVSESALVGRKIGDSVKGDFLGLTGYELQITGGSDKQGFPMRPDIPGSARKKALLTGPPGFHPKAKGERKRKSVRGNTVSEQIAQVNLKVTKFGSKTLEQIFGKKEEPKKEEPKKEEKPEEKKAPEAKAEKKEEEPKKEAEAKKEAPEPKAEEPKKEEKAEEKKEEPEKKG